MKTNSFLKFLFLFGVMGLPFSFLQADENKSEVQISSTPIGSPFFRHLAYDFNLDLEELVKFEKKGFGRAETVTLVLLSKTTGKPLKEFGKRRLKEDVTLKTMAEEASLDYATLYKVVGFVKEGIEAKGENNLPPPVFQSPPKEAGKSLGKEKQP